MALDYKKFKSTIEADALFDTPKYDHKDGRKAFADRLDRALGQVNKTRGGQGGRDYEVGHNDQIRFTPTLNGQRVFVESADEPYFPVSSTVFADFIEAFKGNVDAGHYDDQIKAALEADAPAKASSPRKAAAKKSNDPKPWQDRKGWATLTFAEKQTINANYRNGMNPDRSLIAESGHKPDALIVGNPKKPKKA